MDLPAAIASGLTFGTALLNLARSVAAGFHVYDSIDLLIILPAAFFVLSTAALPIPQDAQPVGTGANADGIPDGRQAAASTQSVCKDP